MREADSPQIGILWDITNCFRTGTREDEFVKLLSKYILYTHIKDALGHDYKLLGEGNSPIENSVKLLKSNSYLGFFGVEWEKAWVPELPDGSIALPQYSKKLREYYGK